MRHHLRGRPRPQDVGMSDVGAADHEGVHERQHLAPRQGTTDTAGQLHRVIDQPLQTQAQNQNADQRKPGVGHQVLVIEGRLGALDDMRR
jgi:hypothetical protein